MKHTIKNSGRFSLLIFFFLFFGTISYSQNPDCDAGVPYFLVDLTGSPAGVWASPNISRNEQCCGAPGSDQCISFDVILDTGAVGIQIDMIGADPAGSLYYSIGCLGSYPGGTVKCITGVGPHRITFCKPGNNKNIYTITSISKPNFPDDQHVRIGCSQQLVTLGIVSSSTTWQSIFPGAPGTYNSYLSCTNCASPNYTPATTAPAYIDYYVCGFPIASTCGYNFTVCDTVRIFNDAQLTGNITPSPAIFCNVGPGSGVTLSALGSGGLPPYSYTWRNSSSVIVGTGSTYFATTAGNYSVEISDSLNSPTCPSYYNTVTVSVGELPVVTAGSDQTVCATSPTVNLSGTVTNASGGIWSGGSGVFNPGNTFLNTLYTPTSAELLAGSVTLTLTSTGAGGGCTNSTDQVIINFSDSILINIPSASLACNSSSTTLSANVTGGTAPLSYQWNNGTAASSVVVGQGNYSVIVTDAIGCTGTQFYNLTAPTALSISFTTVDVSVNGGSDGQASVIVSGGTAPYTYSWSPGGQTTANITGLPYGIYEVTVTDANGCVISGSVVVNEPRCNGFNVTAASTNVSCYGSNNGTGTAVATGGTSPYVYSWNTTPVQTTAVASNLQAGVYTIVVTDANACLQTANIIVTEPTMLTDVMNQTNPTTIGGTNGSAIANPFGGVSPYTYLWSTGGTTQTISGLSEGVYVVTITDINGCTKVDSVMLLEPPCNHIALSVVTSNVACYGGSTGVALSTLTGATAPVSINWSNGQSGPTASGMPAGNYTVTITDANNCSLFSTFTITQPTVLSAGASINPISCNGLSDGTVDLNVSGGVYPYTFSWSNGSTNEDLINVGPNAYTANINDYNGCATSVNVLFTNPSALSTSYIVQQPTCIFGSDGSIDFSISGGELPYTYNWSNGAITQDLTGIQAGGYSLLLNDANGCTTSSPIIISVLETDSVIVASYTIACSVPGSGVSLVTVVPSGGNPGIYQVSFDNGITFQSAGDYTALLPNGATYNVVVKDITGCTSLSVFAIEVKPSIVITASVTSDYSGQNISCAGLNDGSATAVTTGGTAPYTYSWSTTPSQTTATAINLDASTYTVTTTDINGCTNSTTITLTDPLALTATSAAASNFNGFNISCNGLSDGSIDLTASGGTSPFVFAWSNGGITEDLLGLTAGTYTVTITDANGCTTTSGINLVQSDPVLATINVLSNYNGFGVSCFNNLDGTIDINVAGGTSTYTYLWSNGATTQDVTSLPSGTYLVTVTDANNCSDTMTTVLTQPTAMLIGVDSISNYNGYNVSCFNSSDGLISLTTSGGVSPYNFLWNNAEVTEDINSIPYGGYLITVTDANNCVLLFDTILTQPSDLIPVATTTSVFGDYNVSCNGSTNGAIDLNVTGGLMPYNYSWSNAASTEDINSLGAGTYSITVTDLNGCSDSTFAIITQPDSLIASINSISDYNGFAITCFGDANGSIDAGVSGGMAPYDYSWSNGATIQDIVSLNAGNYTLVVTDSNNCVDSISTILNEPLLLVAVIDSISNYNGYGVSCNLSSNGSVYSSVSGGVAPYTYLWSNGASTDDISGLNANSYILNITDLNGCLTNTDTTLIEPSAFNSSYTFVNPGCNGLSNGSIDFSLSGGVIPYTFDWSNGAASEDLINIPIGTYNLVYNDLNGCVDSISVTLIEPLVLSNNIAQQDVLCYGDSNGSIDINIIGGTLPYSFLWSNGSTLEDVDSLTQGIYFVTITDAQGCSRIDTINITQPDPLALILTSTIYSNGHNITFYQGTDGSIDATVVGGIQPYSYIWTSGQTQDDINNLSAGQYSLVVTDQHGCIASGSLTLTEPFDLAMPTGITPNDDGKNDFFLVKGIEAYPDNVLTIYNRWGNSVYKKENYLNEWRGTNTGGQDLPEGTYFAVLEINGREIVLNGYVEIRKK